MRLASLLALAGLVLAMLIIPPPSRFDMSGSQEEISQADRQQLRKLL